MPADLTKPFNESCCDGGECGLSDMSAQPCGCDKGANHLCERHRYEVEEATATSPASPYITSSVARMLDGSQCKCELLLTPIGSSSTSLDLYWTQQHTNLAHIVHSITLGLEEGSSPKTPAKEPEL